MVWLLGVLIVLLEDQTSRSTLAVNVCSEGQGGVCTARAASHSAASFTLAGPPSLRDPPQVRHRECLPDSHMPWMPEFLGGPTASFPAVFEYGGSENVEHAGGELDSFLDEALPRFGAIVVKRLPLTSPESFSQLMHATSMTLVDYIGGVTSRPNAAAKVTPASTEPAHVSMEPHMDNPYWPVPPARLILFVGKPPHRGGQALLSDTRAILRQLREQYPEVLEEFERRGIRYEHFYPDPDADGTIITSWKESLAKECAEETGCNATEVAEAAMRAKGFAFEWIAGGLKRWEVIPAVLAHPVSGEEAWANMFTAMHCSVFDNHPEYPELNRPPEERSDPCTMRGQMPYHTTYGDGGTVPVSVVHTIRRVQWENSVSFDYEAGDMLAIDNYLALHGRFSFEPPRDLYLTMVGR